MDEVLDSVAFVNTNNAVVISQLCGVLNSLKEFRQEVSEIKTCRAGKVCGKSMRIRRGMGRTKKEILCWNSHVGLQQGGHQ